MRRRIRRTRIWFECGPWVKPEALSAEERNHWPYGSPSIDLDLCCGGVTFEEALITLANLVLEKYGVYEDSGGAEV